MGNTEDRNAGCCGGVVEVSQPFLLLVVVPTYLSQSVSIRTKAFGADGDTTNGVDIADDFKRDVDMGDVADASK